MKAEEMEYNRFVVLVNGCEHHKHTYVEDAIDEANRLKENPKLMVWVYDTEQEKKKRKYAKEKVVYTHYEEVGGYEIDRTVLFNVLGDGRVVGDYKEEWQVWGVDYNLKGLFKSREEAVRFIKAM